MSRTITKTNSQGYPQTVTYSDVTLDKIEAGQYQKPGTTTAQIRQVITTVTMYPSKQTSSNMQQGLFDNAEFGFAEQPFSNTENRIAWILVPVGTTEEELRLKLAAANQSNATIYKMLSNQPILDNNQKNAIRVGLGDVTLDTFANSQVVRYPMGVNHAQEGQICLTNNKVQYRRTFFWNTPLEDQDLRSTDPADVYMSPEIKLELASKGVTATTSAPNIMEGQTL